jgi:hypothetical protein
LIDDSATAKSLGGFFVNQSVILEQPYEAKDGKALAKQGHFPSKVLDAREFLS